MYTKIFELINDEISMMTISTPSTLELVKIEIKGIKVKLVYLDKKSMKVQVRLYEVDLFSQEPKLKLKKDYMKPYTDKYFR
mgnify:CR=1 FL=1